MRPDSPAYALALASILALALTVVAFRNGDFQTSRLTPNSIPVLFP